MKTVFLFNESDFGRKVLLKHDKCVTFSRESRNETPYIVIRFPTGYVNMDAFNLRSEHYLSSGFSMHTSENETELLFYDQVTFTWVLKDLEALGLFRVTQRHIPNEEDVYAYYIDAKGIRQWGYNAFFMSLQWLIEQKRKMKEKKEQA